jgi:hypothetical protein
MRRLLYNQIRSVGVRIDFLQAVGAYLALFDTVLERLAWKLFNLSRSFGR